MVAERDNNSIKNEDYIRELVGDFLEYGEKMRESYLKSVVDFIKWTSTVTIGAILWVSNTQNVNEGKYGYFAIISLLFLIFSLILAIFVIYFVLRAWSAEWRFSEMFGGILQTFLKPLKIEKLREDLMRQAVPVAEHWLKFRKPETFNCLIAIHIFLIISGLLFYILSIVL